MAKSKYRGEAELQSHDANNVADKGGARIDVPRYSGESK
jgi:hypothetical protein